MKKTFAVFDIDGTVIRWQLYHALGDAMAKKGIISASDFTGVRHARMRWKQRGNSEAFKEYEAVLVVAFDKGLAGLEVTIFDELVDAVFEEYKNQVYTYTRDLIADLKQKNYLLFAISGSPDAIVGKVASHYGFDDFMATRYPTVSGRFTGQKELSVGRKAEFLNSLIKRHKAIKQGSIAVGDTDSDIEMLSLTDQPIAFNPSLQLFNYAKNAGWQIVVERKNMVYQLEAQGGSYLLAQTNS